jgi:uncharacterized protein YndB with AHSA1/START domain
MPTMSTPRPDSDTGPPPPTTESLRVGTYILAPISRAWDAITVKHRVDAYYLTCLTTDSEPVEGAPWRYGGEEDPVILGTVTTADAPQRFSHTFTFSFLPEMGPTAVDYDLVSVRPGVTHLTITHSELPADNAQLLQDLSGGWEQIVSGLKSYLETGVGIGSIGAPAVDIPAMPEPGLLILRFADEAAGESAGLRAGDLITAYAATPTPTITALRAAIDARRQAGATDAEVTVRRDGESMAMTIPVGQLGAHLHEAAVDPAPGLESVSLADLAWEHAVATGAGDRFTRMALDGSPIGAERQWWRYADGLLQHRSQVAMRVDGDLYTHTTTLTMPAGPDGIGVRSFRIAAGVDGAAGETTVAGGPTRIVCSSDAGDPVAIPLLDGETVAADFASEWLAALMPLRAGCALRLSLLIPPDVRRDAALVVVGEEAVPGAADGRTAWRVELRHGQSTTVYWIDGATRQMRRADYNGPVAVPVSADAGAAALAGLLGD